MVEIKDRLEVDRLRNLTQGFGWEVVREEYEDENILITLKKPRANAQPGSTAGPD